MFGQQLTGASIIGMIIAFHVPSANPVSQDQQPTKEAEEGSCAAGLRQLTIEAGVQDIFRLEWTY